jgi:hypothetical protein
MARALLLLGTIACLALGGCGGEESSQLCQDLRVAQDAVKEIREIDLEEGAAEMVQQSAGKLRSSLADVEAEAGDQLAPQLDAVKSSFGTLRQELQAVAAQSEITRESLQSVAPAVTDAVESLQALAEAAPDCDLSESA